MTIMGHHKLIARRGSNFEFDAGVMDLWAGGPLDRRLSALINPSFDIENGGVDVEQAFGKEPPPG